MTGSDRLRGILDLVEESLDEPQMTGDDLAGRAFLSRFHFDRLAAAALGEPPGAFRRRLLLERAAHRLAATTDPVIEGDPMHAVGGVGADASTIRRRR